MGGKFRDKILALLSSSTYQMKPFVDLFVFPQLLFTVVWLSLYIRLATPADHIYYTLHHWAREPSTAIFTMTLAGVLGQTYHLLVKTSHFSL